MIPGTVMMPAKSSVLNNFQIFTSSGSFTVPTGVTRVFVVVAAAGGTGGPGRSFSIPNDQGGGTGWYAVGGDGGQGGVSVGYLNVTPTSSITATVGSYVGWSSGGFAGSSSFSTMSATGGENGYSYTSESIQQADFTTTVYYDGVDGAVGAGSGGSLYNNSMLNESTVDSYITNHVLSDWNNPAVSTADISALIADSSILRTSNESTTWSTSSTNVPGAGGKGQGPSGWYTGMSGLILVAWGGAI